MQIRVENTGFPLLYRIFFFRMYSIFCFQLFEFFMVISLEEEIGL